MKTCSLLSAALLLLSAAESAIAGPEWIERGDAGSLPPTSQPTTGSGAVKKISGSLSTAGSLAGAGDTEDMYLINITDPANFYASTTSFNPYDPDNPGSAEFDSTLYLFSVSVGEGEFGVQGFGLLGNNNTPIVIPVKGKGQFVTGSTLLPAANDGSGVVITEPGLYLLAISTAFTEPLAFTGEISEPMFTFALQTEISGPDGPGGEFPIGSWTPQPPPPPGLRQGGLSGAYEIALNGVELITTTPIEAAVDIRPGICPNNFNVYLAGTLSASVLGTTQFDITAIDVTTIQISRADGVGTSVPVNSDSLDISDVGTPFPGDSCDCHSFSGDGFDDLFFKFDKQAMIDNLDFGSVPCGTAVELVISFQTLDGGTYAGNDCIVIID